jgi:hypothetical protein
MLPTSIYINDTVDFDITFNTTGSTCPGACNGIIIATPTNLKNITSDDIYYSIDGSSLSTASTFSNLCVGLHNITAQTRTGCSKNYSVIIEDLNTFKVSYDTTPTSSLFASDGTITITVTGGESVCVRDECYYINRNSVTFTDGQYTYRGLRSGTYTYVISDDINCSRTINVIVGVEEKPKIKNLDTTTYRIDIIGGSKIVN